ncbi:M50 family metallopeptidase [Clostridium sp. MB40-C1]|uniref:M50 family metallopeptidase n=1 Tax=Clostridium sp. MB40-C1 TaxID=3070996 RepID=UPI0027E18D85|nr:M50 family metallopeptidase [Clostridium sp. MB40-C1]WMJ82029.1 M50 family metallopeptidase [Clostridium sp. MB40-C1]
MHIIFNILIVVIAFSILVIIHELGHFTFAKLNGVKVEEFSIGMGPKLFGIQGKETLYAFRAVPIGGYVRMLGEEGDSTDERAFSNKSPSQRLSIVAAGPIMNFILAIILFAIVTGFTGYSVPIVSKIIPNSPAMEAGIKPGDKILEVNKHNISTWEDFKTEVAIAKGSQLNMRILRGEEEKTFLITAEKNLVGIYATTVESPGALQSLKQGFKQTTSTIKQTVLSLGMIFKGKASKDDIGGPVTILRVTWQISKAGLLNLVAFSAFISVQLGIFNLLPFPALDGFWIFVSLYQIITRKQVDKDKIGIINTVGFALLLLLMVLVTIKDVMYPIKF